MKQRSVWFAMLVLLAAALLAACTPQPAAEDEATAEPTEEMTAEPTEEMTAEPTEAPTEAATEEATEEATAEMVELLIWADETRSPLIEQLSPIAEQYGVRLTVQQMGFGDIRDQLAVAGPAGEGPDLFIGAHDWLGQLVENGLVAEIDLAGKEDQFLPAALDAFTYGGTLYGVPYATENVAFLCNMDVLGDRAVPGTWDDVVALAEELEAESNGEVTAWTIQTNDPYHLFPLMSAFGGYVFGYDEATGYDASDVGIDSEGTIQAGQFLESMVAAGHLEAGVDYDVMHTLFESGNVACIGTGPWALERINTAGVNYTVNPFPAGDEGPGRPLLGVQGFMVSAFSDNQLLAQTILSEVVATEEFMGQLAEVGDRPSAFLAIRDATDDPDLEAFGVAGAEGLPMPAIPEMSEVWTAWGNAEQLVISGEQDAEAAFTDAAEQIRTAIEGGD